MKLAKAEQFDADLMSAVAFRAFQATRPDYERWELIGGIPLMMTPPTIAHHRIADNLARLINASLDSFDRTRFAVQRQGVDVGTEQYRPEPDVVVIDAVYDATERYAPRAYIFAEIVSASDDIGVRDGGQRWIDAKRDLYRAHPCCEAILFVQQGRVEVQLDRRSEGGWTNVVLNVLDDRLVVPSIGLDCELRDLYEGSPLLPRKA